MGGGAPPGPPVGPFLLAVGDENMSSLINEDEIFARVHKYKLFRKEGNLFIDVYEALVGEPAHKYMAVPNLLFQEADRAYFGVGDTQKDALKDCLRKIRGVPIQTIVPLEETAAGGTAGEGDPTGSQGFGTQGRLRRVFLRRKDED